MLQAHQAVILVQGMGSGDVYHVDIRIGGEAVVVGILFRGRILHSKIRGFFFGPGSYSIEFGILKIVQGNGKLPGYAPGAKDAPSDLFRHVESDLGGLTVGGNRKTAVCEQGLAGNK